MYKTRKFILFLLDGFTVFSFSSKKMDKNTTIMAHGFVRFGKLYGKIKIQVKQPIIQTPV